MPYADCVVGPDRDALYDDWNACPDRKSEPTIAGLRRKHSNLSCAMRGDVDLLAAGDRVSDLYLCIAGNGVWIVQRQKDLVARYGYGYRSHPVVGRAGERE
jgi:hypothetical protein